MEYPESFLVLSFRNGYFNKKEGRDKVIAPGKAQPSSSCLVYNKMAICLCRVTISLNQYRFVLLLNKQTTTKSVLADLNTSLA